MTAVFASGIVLAAFGLPARAQERLPAIPDNAPKAQAPVLTPTEVPDSARIDDLLAQLQDPGQEDWRMIEREIMLEWSKSGSAAMDLLLQRGRDALDAGRTDEAINHLTALTDHAPGFAEGWNMRATAFFSIRRYGLSIADIQRTLALNPRHFGALSGLGMILEEMEYNSDALIAYREAVRLNPNRQDLQDAVARLAILADGTDI
ncbi:tetratricopeptide repeat protein [Brevirhabdus pacifica]|uniref:tetratricopeptide repeat protein n=1 Tax=Brevirhabdus pacifica TaxID=1267768 RepID=UPI001E4E5EE2|nr:tetratricopeptide repeat protein [Brevirhabdus pacifica]